MVTGYTFYLFFNIQIIYDRMSRPTTTLTRRAKANRRIAIVMETIRNRNGNDSFFADRKRLQAMALAAAVYLPRGVGAGREQPKKDASYFVYTYVVFQISSHVKYEILCKFFEHLCVRIYIFLSDKYRLYFSSLRGCFVFCYSVSGFCTRITHSHATRPSAR